MAGRHLFICANGRSAGKPACGPRGGDALVAAVQRELLARKATSEVLVTPCSCLGPCFDGPNAVIYPDGTWYARLDASDAGGLVDHLIDGAPLVAKISQRPGDELAQDD